MKNNKLSSTPNHFFGQANPLSVLFALSTTTLTLLLFLLLIQTQAFAQESGEGTAPWVGKTLNGTPCTGLGQGFGPFDYKSRHFNKSALGKVESHHFTRQVESLIRGQEGYLNQDLDYTVRAWPNHHRALQSIIRYKLLKKKNKNKLLSPVECYLQRAMGYSPNDAIPIILYAIYLQKLGQKQKAYEKYIRAEKLSPNNPELHYNFGLLLVSMKRYDEAKTHAVKAYKRGYPLPGLQRKLKKSGHW